MVVVKFKAVVGLYVSTSQVVNIIVGVDFKKGKVNKIIAKESGGESWPNGGYLVLAKWQIIVLRRWSDC